MSIEKLHSKGFWNGTHLKVIFVVKYYMKFYFNHGENVHKIFYIVFAVCSHGRMLLFVINW